MKKISFSVVCCMLVMVLFVSCAKDGPAGATGATGAAGPGGSAGPAGPAGVPGAPGTANVIYSEWLDVPYSIDTIIRLSNNTLDTSYFSVINAPKLTLDILTKGEIKVYFNLRTAASPVIVPIPYFNGFSSIQPYFFPQSIELDATDNFGTRGTGTSKIFQYRYILIPGSVTGRSIIDWSKYSEVQKYLNLKD
jgi:hypothetical protein